MNNEPGFKLEICLIRLTEEGKLTTQTTVLVSYLGIKIFFVKLGMLKISVFH